MNGKGFTSYVDDSSLYVAGNNVNDIIKLLQKDSANSVPMVLWWPNEI